MLIDRTTKPEPGAHLRTGHWSTDGMIGHWAFNERGGLRAYDLSGKGNHGTLSGPTWTSRGLDFDGDNDLLTLTGLTSTSGTYTLSFWLYLRAVAENFTYILDVQTGRLLFGKNLTDLQIYDGSWRTFSPTEPVYNDYVDAWHNFTISLDAGNSQALLYIDGDYFGVATYTGRNLGGTITFMDEIAATPGYNVNGIAGQFSIYTRILLPSEAKQLFVNPNIVFEPEWLPDVVAPAGGVFTPQAIMVM